MVRLALILLVTLFVLAIANDSAYAAPRCANGVCAAPSGGGLAAHVGHRLASGGPVRNAVGAVLHGDGPVRRLLANRPRLVGRLLGRRGCG